MKFPLQKYLSVIYLLLFVFQIAIFHSTTVKNLSIQSIQAFSDESDDSEPSSDKEDLIDYENDDENEDNQENEEEQEIDGEGDFVKDIGVIALVDEKTQYRESGVPVPKVSKATNFPRRAIANCAEGKSPVAISCWIRSLRIPILSGSMPSSAGSCSSCWECFMRIPVFWAVMALQA